MARSRSPQAPTFWLGLTFLAAGLLLTYLLVVFWPRTVTVASLSPRQPALQAAPVAPGGAGGQAGNGEGKKTWDPETEFLGYSFRLDADVRLLILVLLAGALGSYVHAVQSFASYVGNASFKATWTWWYVLRLPVGAALAVFVYFVVRGGLLAAGTATGSGAANDLNLFGIMSFSGLSGLFSKQAIDKLAEVFDTLFATKEDRKREDRLGENPQPVIAKASLETLPTGETAIAVSGQGFVKSSVVKASGKELPTTFGSAQSLTARIPSGSFDGRLEIEVSVFNPAPGGGTSDPVPLKLTAAPAPGGPAPTAEGVTNVVPTVLTAEAGNGGGAPSGSAGEAP